MSIYHSPVLLHECLEGLNIRPDGIYVDVTFGGGGHSREILRLLNENGRLIAFDQDADAAANSIPDKRFHLVEKNFSLLEPELRKLGITKVDGLLADLGISSHQIDVAERGFSTRFQGPLDMRMDRRTEFDAEHILNKYDEFALKKIFREYGEVDNAGRLAKMIVAGRIESPIRSIAEFKEVIAPCTPKGKEFRYLAKVFQALRIEVNREIDTLAKLLSSCAEVIGEGGRLVVISYHSLEDRMVKNFIRSGNIDGKLEKDFFGNVIKPFEAVNSKPIVPTDIEIEKNNRARSAKLRIAEKTAGSTGNTA